MNLNQCRQALTYLWGTHPAAPRFTDADKAITTASYFRVLHKYSLQDVLNAIDKACRENHTFIPSAYEIETKVVKTTNWEKYITDEYRELNDTYPEFAGCGMCEIYHFMALSLDDPDKYKSDIEKIQARMDIDTKLYQLEREYMAKANVDYDREQCNAAHNDLKRLSFEG